MIDKTIKEKAMLVHPQEGQQIPSLLVEKYGRLVGGQRVQEDGLYRMPLSRRQVVH